MATTAWIVGVIAASLVAVGGLAVAGPALSDLLGADASGHPSAATNGVPPGPPTWLNESAPYGPPTWIGDDGGPPDWLVLPAP